MHDKIPSGNHATIGVILDNKVVFHGDEVHGRVTLNTKLPIENAELMLQILAQEYCEVDANPGDKNQALQNVDIFPVHMQSFFKGSNFPAGTSTSFNYSFLIPAGAPAAFEYSGSNARGYCRYTVNAFLTANSQTGLCDWKKIKVREHLKQATQEVKKEKGMVQGYCYSNKGYLEISCNIKSFPLDQIKSTFEGELQVDNRYCKHAIMDIEGRLLECVSFNAGSRFASFTNKIVGWKLDGVAPEQLKNIPFSVALPLTNAYACLCSSTAGKIVKRSYLFTMEANYNTYVCCAPSISLAFDVEHLKAFRKKDNK